MTSISNRDPFQVSYNSGVQFGYDEGRPPSSAKLVAAVSWSWGPAHSRSECYVICTDRKRTGWTLWAKAYNEDDGRLMYAKLAYGSPYARHTAKMAAKKLLRAAWEGFRKQCGDNFVRGAHVDQEGLLTKDDIDEILANVLGPDPTPETIVECTVWSDVRSPGRSFRSSVREACVKYGIDIDAALTHLRYGSSGSSFSGPEGETVLLTKAR